MAVTTLNIKTCRPFADGITFGEVGSYQQLEGTVHVAVEPNHPRNAGIADLKRAPRDAQGLVQCSADFRILQPVVTQRGNQRLLLDIVNRGNPTVLTNFNSADGRLEPGNGFLMFITVRDMVSFLRYSAETEGNPCAGRIRYAYSFGRSQSGRFLRHFLYLGLNQDEQDRTVCDGLIPLVAGGGRGEFNQRFGQPSNSNKYSMKNLFPFHDSVQTDPETGRTDGLLMRLASQGPLPKVFFINTSAEYWGGHAALTHIDVEGKVDLTSAESVRNYHLAGTQHSPGNLLLTDTGSADATRARHLPNAVDYRPLLRAALVNLDRWVAEGHEPPPSLHPRLDTGTAVAPEHTLTTFQTIPEVPVPVYLRSIVRLDFGTESETGPMAHLPPKVGKPYANLVSAVDADGNEVAGIRLPDISVPLATYTGWNMRHPDIGGVGQTLSLLGSTLPFPATRAVRQASGDPRLAIEERYRSKEDYLEQVRQAAETLVQQGYLLTEDVLTVMAQAAQRYDQFQRWAPAANV